MPTCSQPSATSQRKAILLLWTIFSTRSISVRLELAHIIKIDVLASGRATVAEHVQLLRHYDVQLLAEKVETQEDFTYYKTLGFEYFQGYFFCRPDVVKGQRSPTNRLVILELLAKLQSPRTTFRELEALISRDVSLSYKVLRAANAAMFTRTRKSSLSSKRCSSSASPP